jgi:predicted transcriptional regulator
MSKPKIPAEIREQVGLNRGNNISSTLKILTNFGLLKCLTPKARVGKLYGLTEKGIRQRKWLLKEKGIPHRYVKPRLNWNLYGWVVCGKQKRAILKAMKMPMPLKYIKEKAQEYNPRISRMNCNDILQLFVKKGIVRKIRQAKKVILQLTKTGEKIRTQLFEP